MSSLYWEVMECERCGKEFEHPAGAIMSEEVVCPDCWDEEYEDTEFYKELMYG